MDYKKSMNKKVKNFIRSPKVIFDGLEQDFIDKQNILACPACEGQLGFTLRNATYFKYIDEGLKNHLIASIKAIKGNSGSYYYKKSGIYVCTSQCEFNHHKYNVAFTFEEVQPARYVSWLIGMVEEQC